MSISWLCGFWIKWNARPVVDWEDTRVLSMPPVVRRVFVRI